MSSPPDGPYKSRLLNFINRKAIDLSGNVQKTLRHLKINAEWGIQILLYPIYLLAQTGRIFQRQLQPLVKKAQLLLSSSSSLEQQQKPTEADTPIEEVLKEIEPKLSPTVAIIGVASLLKTRTLVLVDRDNQIVDILTEKQQRKLQQQITWEIANYWHQRRLDVVARFSTTHLPRIETSNPNVLLPLRLFWKMMGWIQTSPVATGVNLFEESKLVGETSKLPAPNVEKFTHEIPSAGILAILDNTIADLEADLETQQLIPPIPLSHTRSNTEEGKLKLQQIKAILTAAIDYFFGQRGDRLSSRDNHTSPEILPQNRKSAKLPQADVPEQELIEPSEEYPWLSPADLFIDTQTNLVPEAKNSPTLNKVDVSPLNKGEHRGVMPVSSLDKEGLRGVQKELNTNEDTSKSLENSKPNFLKIQTLILAAIDYFFGQHQQQMPGQGSDRSSRTQGQSNNLPPRDFHSLSGTDDVENLKIPEGKEADPWLLEEDLFREGTSNKAQSPRVSRGTSVTQKRKSLPHKQQASQKLATSAKDTTHIAPSAEKSDSIAQSRSNNTTLERAEDVVETIASSVGYVKHPLERILEWLDRAIFFVEELVGNIWRSLRKK